MWPRLKEPTKEAEAPGGQQQKRAIQTLDLKGQEEEMVLQESSESCVMGVVGRGRAYSQNSRRPQPEW